MDHAILNGKPFGIPNLSLKTTQNTFQSLGCMYTVFVSLLITLEYSLIP
jgi:hypothetical protein